jgi:hypothetical protein
MNETKRRGKASTSATNLILENSGVLQNEDVDHYCRVLA